MISYKCDGSYKTDLKEYTEQVLDRIGTASPMAVREIIYMSERGNTVACKQYADTVFYTRPAAAGQYRRAFELYLKASGLCAGDAGEWKSDVRSYPQALWMVGYYLVNYKRESVLIDCEDIPELERMTLADRYSLALVLACGCLEYEDSPAALNLLGRIVQATADDEALYKELADVIGRELSGRAFKACQLPRNRCTDSEECRAVAHALFEAAAAGGYVYASNNLADREAEDIVKAVKDGLAPDELKDRVDRYVGYLTLSADKFEPYAANRLGLFYYTGEIKCGQDSAVFKDRVNTALAKSYFIKATRYHDTNSAWAYYNLIRYYHRDYARDIDLLNEHMDRIKVLSREVYDLAIEL